MKSAAQIAEAVDLDSNCSTGVKAPQVQVFDHRHPWREGAQDRTSSIAYDVGSFSHNGEEREEFGGRINRETVGRPVEATTAAEKEPTSPKCWCTCAPAWMFHPVGRAHRATS